MPERLFGWGWWQTFAVILFVLLVVGSWIGWTVLWKASTNALVWSTVFAQGSGRRVETIAPEFMGGFLSGRAQPVEVARYLILGKDEVEGSNRQVTLTDTLIVASYRPAEGKVRLLNLPRDLYHPREATKINALYWYGLDKTPNNPVEYPQQIFEEMLGVEFDGVILVSLSDVKEVIDILGGVELDVPRSFTDSRFPRSGVDVTRERDPAKLYETVSFESGKQIMNGELALKYIRSRYGNVPEEATDEARSLRQQQVIEALAARIVQSTLITRPHQVGQLFGWYADRYEQVVSLTALGKLLGSLEQSNKIPQLEKITLPISDVSQATDSATLFVHPPTEKYGQWVYEPVDPTWTQLHQYIQEKGL
jgi:anionic cell wall polymer biosynthesis LytR-Cps2A-Psr (LCP) family protein